MTIKEFILEKPLNISRETDRDADDSTTPCISKEELVLLEVLFGTLTLFSKVFRVFLYSTEDREWQQVGEYAGCRSVDHI